MADNYLEKQYEQYQARKAAWEARKRKGKKTTPMERQEAVKRVSHAPIAVELLPSDEHGKYHEVETMEELRLLLERQKEIHRCAFQNMNFHALGKEAGSGCTYRDCIFMGCHLTEEMKEQLDASCLVFSQIDVPYNPFRNTLYTAESLYAGYRKGEPESYEASFDNRIYRHYLAYGKTATDIKETLARTLHDHAVSDALHEFLAGYDPKRVVGIMGGHGLLRTDEYYRKVVMVSKTLTEQGCVMVSGGGPGAMEATHLGAWMAGRTDDEVEAALQMLAVAPSYRDRLWLDTAFAVRDAFPQQTYKSLGVPTWLYGHEPATPFATHIAKYFENALREDGILTIAMGGVIYSPGSAGTMQEIFQDAVQNHYLSFGYASPMVFLGVKHWSEDMPIYPLLQQLLQGGRYKNLLLTLSDEVAEIVQAIL